jgi:AcrR family transcriptional regulator
MSADLYTRRRQLYERAAPVFRRYGYRNATLKALANACGLSIPALYRYFPSKRVFATFPLVSLHPELHPVPPEVAGGDPLAVLAGWIDGAAAEMPNYTLAVRLAREAGLTEGEQRKVDANLAAHIALVGAFARSAAPHLDERTAGELVSTMISVALGSVETGLPSDPAALRRQLRALLRGYGLVLPRRAPAGASR